MLREIDFLLKVCGRFLLVSPAEYSYLNTDMYKFETSQKDESRAQSADSSKEYRKPRAFICQGRIVSLGWNVGG